MKDEHLLELREKIEQLHKHDASHVAGFSSVLGLIVNCYEGAGTPLQKSYLSFLTKEVQDVLMTKTEHGKFKHLVK